MDVNQTLADIRRLRNELEGLDVTDEIGCIDADAAQQIASKAMELSDRIGALDRWLCSGGFRPVAWDK